MRSPFAYMPRPRPLQLASPSAAVAYLGSLIVVAFLYSNPIVLLATGAALIVAGELAGARRAVRAALWMGLTLALLVVVVNALVVSRGATVLARLGEWPLFGQVDVTAEAIAAGAVLGLRAAVVMVGFGVYTACVDPDRVLRALRPIAGRSALTATLVSRLVPVAAADAARLRDAACLRGPGAAPVGKAPLARRLLAGSLDRAVDVAATLELRGYSLSPPSPSTAGVTRSPSYGRIKRYAGVWRGTRSIHGHSGSIHGHLGSPPRRRRSRYDRRFYLAGVAVLATAIAGKALGADSFAEYPAIEVGTEPVTLAVSVLVLLSGLAPLQRRPRPATSSVPPTVDPPRGAVEVFGRHRRTASSSPPPGGRT